MQKCPKLSVLNMGNSKIPSIDIIPTTYMHLHDDQCIRTRRCKLALKRRNCGGKRWTLRDTLWHNSPDNSENLYAKGDECIHRRWLVWIHYVQHAYDHAYITLKKEGVGLEERLYKRDMESWRTTSRTRRPCGCAELQRNPVYSLDINIGVVELQRSLSFPFLSMNRVYIERLAQFPFPERR